MQKTPTLVQPVPYGHAHSAVSNSPDKNGININENALQQLRQALRHGVYAGQFNGPHLAPLYPQTGKIKYSPTRRPVVLSQEYIDTLDTNLIGAGK